MIVIAKRLEESVFYGRVKEIRPDVEILSGKYQNMKSKFHVRHTICGYEWDVSAHALLQPKGCPMCNGAVRKTQKMFENELYKINPNIEILGEYITNQTPILCRCKIDDYEWEYQPLELLQGQGCPVCSNHLIIPGINNLNTVYPEVVKYLTNPDDGLYMSPRNSKKISCTCPDCGYQRDMQVISLTKYGFSCKRCGDGISYPNKFIRELLRQVLNNEYECEYSPDWAGRALYDTYFKIGDKEYIVEMDGEFHYKAYRDGKLTTEETQKIDKEKEKLASKHNIKVIRIDSRKSNVDHIRKNIENSELRNIFDLSIIDWELCDERASSSIIKEVSVFYEKHKYDMTLTEIGNHFKIHPATVVRYITKGKKFGWCNTSVEERRQLCYGYINNTQQIPIRVYKEEKLFGEYQSLSKCVNALKEYGFAISISTIQKKIKTNNGEYRNFIFEYI